MKALLRALRYRNYRLFFYGQSISLTGTWLTRVAISWLVYRLSRSVFLLGVVGFVGQIPTFLLVPLAGVLADRWDRYRILVVTQVLLMAQVLTLAFLALSQRIEIWHILVLSFVQGLINAFDIPARQTFLVQMVEKPEDLGNAIALNSSMFNSARLVGPAIAGILIATVGEGMCFLVDGLSYLAVIMSLLMMKVKPRKVERPFVHVLYELKEGFRYAFRFLAIRSILVLVGWVSLLGMSYTVLLPVFAKEVLHGGPGILGFLTSAAGLGALGGAIYLALRQSVFGLGKHIMVATGLGGAGLLFLAFSHSLDLSLLFIVLASFGFMVQMASSNTILQTIVEDDKRGRIMSLYTMAFLGMAPFGNLLVGVLASHIGVPRTIMISGIACMLASLLFYQKLPLLREVIRPIYIRKGIIREVVSGIEVASQLTAPKD